MISEPRTQLVSRSVKAVIAVLLVAFIAVQGHVLFGDGGIMSKYTFLQGFTMFGDLMRKDPLTTAGLIDLVVLMLTMIVVLANGIPRGRYYALQLAGFVIALIIYPGLACLGFLLFYWNRLGQFRP